MKITLLSLASMIAITMGTNAEQVEFRLVTLRGESLSDERIKELLSVGGLGLEHRYVVPVEEGRLSFEDTREVQYPTEFSEDGAVVKKETIKLGATITGKVIETGGVRSMEFNFSFCNKEGDQVIKSQGGIALVTPVFTKAAKNGEWVLEGEGDSWTIMILPNGDNMVNQYLAFRIQ